MKSVAEKLNNTAQESQILQNDSSYTLTPEKGRTASPFHNRMDSSFNHSNKSKNTSPMTHRKENNSKIKNDSTNSFLHQQSSKISSTGRMRDRKSEYRAPNVTKVQTQKTRQNNSYIYQGV